MTVKRRTQMNTDDEVKRPFFPKLARKLALPIFLFWVAVAAVVTVFVPSLEKTTAANAEALVPGMRRRRRMRSSRAAHITNPTTPAPPSFFSKPRAAGSATRIISTTTSWSADYCATKSMCSHC